MVCGGSPGAKGLDDTTLLLDVDGVSVTRVERLADARRRVERRIDAALAAGGTLVSDAQAPSFWVFADPEGNRVCLCTWQERN